MPRNLYSKKWLLTPLILWLIFTPFSATIDFKVSEFFYEKGALQVDHYYKTPFFNFLYDYGTIPANIITILSILGLLSSYFLKNPQPLKNITLLLLLTYALGAGFIINGALKEYWGRDRPKQVEGLGGSAPFRAYYEPNFFNQTKPAKSFSSGHAASGFFFFAFAILGWRYQIKGLFYFGLFLSFFLGILLSLSRIAMGAHFLSDTLFSALVMWYMPIGIDWLLFHGELPKKQVSEHE